MNQREQIPVFNFAGYMTADGDWYDLWAENDYREWIEGTGRCSIMRCLIKKGMESIFGGVRKNNRATAFIKY